jgi:hypothetical protein
MRREKKIPNPIKASSTTAKMNVVYLEERIFEGGPSGTGY